MRKFFLFIILSLPLLLTACGGADTDTGENYGDLLNSSNGLVLTQEEHQAGWGRSECTLCHNLDNIHLEDRSTGVTIDLDAIHTQIEVEGLASCAACHGSNGI